MSFKELLKNEPIVIVEDSHDLLMNLKDLLADLEVPVLTYLDPREALRAIRLRTPSIIFSDMNMPEMNGIELAREVRKMHPRLPFVLLTGFGSKEMAVEGLKVGINDMLDKPLDPAKLIAVAHRFLNERASYLQREREELEVIVNSFVEESQSHLVGIDDLFTLLVKKPLDAQVVDSLFRKIHSIKGSSGTIPFSSSLGQLAATVEASLDQIRRGSYFPSEEMVDLYLTSAKAFRELLVAVSERRNPAEDLRIAVDSLVQQIRQQSGVSNVDGGSAGEIDHVALGAIHSAQDLDRDSGDLGVYVRNEMLDTFLRLSGEMTMLRNYFQILVRDAEAQAQPEILYKKSEEMMRGFNKITDSLQRNVMEIREVKFNQVFAKIPRIVRLASHELDKKVNLEFIGGELGVDKNTAKDLDTILLHMVRNSVDHGIEAPNRRLMLEKPAEGKISIEVTQQAGIVRIAISDDGAGLDTQKILEKAIQMNLVDAETAKKLTPSEIMNFIFKPGFSTATHVTSISGRGVGMDVVNNILTTRKARLEVESELGKGTKFIIHWPVPKNIIVESTVLAKDKGLVFAIPQAEIAHITVLKGLQMNEVGGRRTFQFKGMTIPMASYSELTQTEEEPSQGTELENRSVVILQYKDRYLGLIVDQVEGQMDSVVLPFDSVVKNIRGFKGTTLLGSSGLAYIVSVQQMVGLVQETHCEKDAVA